MERLKARVLDHWQSADDLEDLAARDYPLTTADLDHIGPQRRPPASYYAEESKPFGREVVVSPLCRGRIGWVEVLDPQDGNRKCRPAVIVTPDADIQPDGEVWVVAISTQRGAAPAEVQVDLPWDPRGHPRTGLRERCAAVCTWMEKVRVASIQGCAGTVSGHQLLDILSRIKPPDLPAEPTVPAGERVCE